jgi:hypothetical protein
MAQTRCMRSGLLAAVLILTGAGASSGEDARSIVARAVAANEHSDRLMRDYVFQARNETRELNSAGGVKSVHAGVDEILSIGGKRFVLPLEKDGKPLPPAEAAKEQAKLDRAVAEAKRLTDAEREKRMEDGARERASRQARLRDVPDAYDFRLLGETVVDGRAAFEIEATPRPEYQGRYRNILHNIEGKLWIDKQDYNWVRVELEVLRTFSLGLFLARIGEGTHVSFEMMRINDDVWAPRRVSLTASARLALIRKINVEQEVIFSGYRKFQTDSRIVSAGGDQ